MKNQPTNLLDQAIAYVAPQFAVRRLQARMTMAVAGGYNGASLGRPGLSGWAPRATDANSVANYELGTLRGRTRDLARNSPLATGALNTMVTNVVGTGISLQPCPDAQALGLSDEEAQAWADSTLREYKLWAESTACDVTRTQNIYGLQALVFRSALESGDVFTLLPSVKRAGQPYKTALQIIEADRVCNPGFVRDTPELSAGIEVDNYGAPIAYQVCQQHPGTLIGRAAFKWDRITAYGNSTGRRNVLHLFDRKRPGQNRGIPILAPVIEPLKQLQRYTDAELQAAVISGMFAIFVKMDPEAFQDMFDQDGKAAYLQSSMGWDGTVNGSSLDGAGKAINLLPGESVESSNPGRPNAMFDPFVQAIIRQIGVALELPFEVLIKHFTASYSAARAALLDAWKLFRGRRDWLATNFCQPVYETWLEEAVAIGRVRAPGFFADPAIRRAWAAAMWIGDGPGSIDPAKEVTAAKERIALGISTRAAESILHDGVDWRVKHKQLVEEEERRREDGLTASPAAAAMPEPVEPNETEDPEDDTEDSKDGEDKPVKKPESAVNLTVNVSTQAAPPAAVTNNFTLPEQKPADVHAHFEAVMPSVAAPAVNVTVSPTPVTLEATIESAPAQVIVQHPAAARQTVERDEATQEITATVTTYEYAK